MSPWAAYYAPLWQGAPHAAYAPAPAPMMAPQPAPMFVVGQSPGEPASGINWQHVIVNAIAGAVGGVIGCYLARRVIR